MARWSLQAAHYLMTDPPTEWEYKETSRETGRQVRTVAKVPRLLDPKDPSDHNYPDEIIVCDGNNPQGRDIIFIGQPTADMKPIDDEAKKISQDYIDRGVWDMPEPGMDYGEGLIKKFMEKMDKIAITPVSAGGVDPKDFAALQVQVKALMEENAKLKRR